MTTQIAVRLSDEDLGYIDQLVAEGKAKSRADAVRGFIDAARKASRDAADAAAYAATGDPDDPDAVHGFIAAARKVSRDAADAAAYAATGDPDDLEALARWAGVQRLDVE